MHILTLSKQTLLHVRLDSAIL